MPKKLDIELTLKEKQALTNVVVNAIESNNVTFSNKTTDNGWSITFWDNLSSEMEKQFGAINCKPFIVRRGYWKFAIVYLRGAILVFMREQRFLEIKKQFSENSKCTHYLPSFANALNVDVPIDQQNLFDVNNNELKEKARETTIKVLKNVYSEHEKINRLGLVLFDADRESLYSMRLVLINGALEICDEDNLSAYIKLEQSIVTENVIEYPEIMFVDPSKGLRFTSKAQNKKANKERTYKQETKQDNIKSIK